MGYPTDLTNEQWELIKHHFAGSRHRKHDKEVLFNGVLYLQNRLPMAYAAQRFSTIPNRTLILPENAAKWHLGSDNGRFGEANADKSRAEP